MQQFFIRKKLFLNFRICFVNLGINKEIETKRTNYD